MRLPYVRRAATEEIANATAQRWEHAEVLRVLLAEEAAGRDPRARGASHTHATRILGRAWCQIIWRLWHDHDTYDPQQHTALQRLITAAA
jgi:hypothetical protein